MAKKVSLGHIIAESNPDVIALSETWLRFEVSSSEFFQQDITLSEKTDLMGMVVSFWHAMTYLIVKY